MRIIWFTFLYSASDTILVVVEHIKSEVQTALEPCGLKIRLDIVSIPAAEDWGTADTLRFLSDRIKVCLSLFTTLRYFTNRTCAYT